MTVLSWPHDQRRIEVMVGGDWLCTACPRAPCRPQGRAEVLAERRRQKSEADTLRRKAARRARYGLSPATPTADATPSTVLTRSDAAETAGQSPARAVSMLGLETD